MRISVIVKPNSKKESVELTADGSYLVRVHAPPVDDKANQRVVELLACYLKKPKSALLLVRGQKSKNKTFEIE